MENRSKFAAYDPVDYLTSEELVKLFLGEMRADGSAGEIHGAEEVARRACARHGLSLAAAGLLDAAGEACPASAKPGSKKRAAPQPEPLAAG
ncbi:MAG: hypothetical protein LBH93_02105 [Chitinispirillales bacterium]|jgi:hypothetical protein|nr:hypothetical protein [Chitinispirillales bacterium]